MRGERMGSHSSVSNVNQEQGPYEASTFGRTVGQFLYFLCTSLGTKEED